jgi:hypothetical protein
MVTHPGAYPHVCPPAWKVWSEDRGETQEDARLIYSYTAQGAAEDWAEQDDRDSAEYLIANGLIANGKGGPTMVSVSREPEGLIERFNVYGEYNPVYWAEPA